MKHSIPVKFIAVLLCAASLLAAVGSGLSIVTLAESGLYEKTPSQLYAERLEDLAWAFAEQTAQNYASTHLGSCPEEMLGHHSYFNPGSYGYTITDETGAVLEELPLEEAPASFTHSFTVGGSYMKVLNTYGTSSAPTTVSGDDCSIYDAIAQEGSLVYEVNFQYATTAFTDGSEQPMGMLSHTADGRAMFTSYDPNAVDIYDDILNGISFYGADGQVIYEISGAGSVGDLYRTEDGLIHFTAAVPSAAVSPAESVPPTEPAPTEMTVPATEPAAEMARAGVSYFSYWDQELAQEITVEYTWEVMPDYTVTVTLLPDATYESYNYTLAGVLCNYQDYYPWLLGIGLLLFAVTLVYLCCAAGRKAGTDEVRPRALNRLPLDLYAGLGSAAVVGLAIAMVEGGTALFRDNSQVGLGFAAACGYGIALICVGFVFAFAAQVKSKNRYWLRNTLCARILLLILRFFRWLKNGIRKAWPALCTGTKKGWGWFKKAAVKAYLFIENAIIKFCLFLWRITKVLWQYTLRACRRIWAVLARFLRWLGGHIRRFFSLLPLTWQWLLLGFTMILLLFTGAANRLEGLLVFSICFCIALVLYGAHCFGILLESARKMRKGDLETKVDDRLLMGSFRDFSEELNGLAGVTTVAVQKQLKSERMKTELITNVSHDIKTPLTSIINYVDLMKMPHTEEEHELYLEVLDRQSQRLKKLIEDLMEMSKASTGNISVDLIPLDAAEAVNQALGEFCDKFRTVGLTPVFHHPEEPVTVLADGRLIWRVLSNLLGNACKYALPGTRLYIDLMVLEGRGVIAIKNISKEQLNVDAEELMERFVRGDASRNTEGSGLGLNIAKSLVELQQGQMELTVDGDLFKVTLLFPLA